MNRNTRIVAAIIALSLAAAGSAFADDITIDTTSHASLKSRADVNTELAQYRQKGVNPWSTSYNMLTGFKAQANRADVVAEVNAARASGELAAMASEDSGSAYLAQVRRPVATSGTVLAQHIAR